MRVAETTNVSVLLLVACVLGFTTGWPSPALEPSVDLASAPSGGAPTFSGAPS